MTFLILFFWRKKTKARLKTKYLKIIQVRFLYCIKAENKPTPPLFFTFLCKSA